MSGAEFPAIGALMAGSGTAAAGAGGASAVPQILMGSAMAQMVPQILEQTITGQPSLLPMGGPGLGVGVDPTHAFPDTTLTEPLAALAGVAPAATAPAPAQIPPLPQPSPWKEALANTALVQDMALKHRQAGRIPNAPAPNFYIPQGVKAPKFGSPPAGGQSPMQRFAMLLRS